jgi:hypothetical protein
MGNFILKKTIIYHNIEFINDINNINMIKYKNIINNYNLKEIHLFTDNLILNNNNYINYKYINNNDLIYFFPIIENNIFYISIKNYDIIIHIETDDSTYYIDLKHNGACLCWLSCVYRTY